MFVEREVPQLSHICTFTDSNKTTNIDFCPNLICLAESVSDFNNSYIIFPGKIGYIYVVVMQHGCIMNKHTIQIPYSYSFKITALVTQVIKQNSQKINSLSKGVYVFIGFQDGTIMMSILVQNGQNRKLPQIFKMRPNLRKKQPVINFKLYKAHLIVVCAYSAFIFKNIFAAQGENAQAMNKKIDKLKEEQIKININSCKLDVEIDENNQSIYFYNQFEGAVCLSLDTFTEVKKIQDSLKLIRVCHRLTPKQIDIAVFGNTDDNIKFINYTSNTVTKFIGLKNYPTWFEEDLKNGLLWVSFLDGSVACFQYLPKKQERHKQLHMEIHKLKYMVRICENGIKKMMIHNNVLIVFDSTHSIQFYDIELATYSSSGSSSQEESEEESSSKNKGMNNKMNNK